VTDAQQIIQVKQAMVAAWGVQVMIAE